MKNRMKQLEILLVILLMVNIAQNGLTNPKTYFLNMLIALPGIVIGLSFHEFGHAFVSDRLGDPTPRAQGRVTLNPLAHIDYIGAACILLVGFGWAKPVGVNPTYFKHPKRDMAITALAGPVSNLIVALISLIICNIFRYLLTGAVFFYFAIFFFYIASINVSLAVFNLIPIPPLDGGRFVVEIFQKVSRKVVSLRALGYMSTVGIVLFTGFFLVMVNQDVQRFIFGNWS